MTNTKQITINQVTVSDGRDNMDAWIDQLWLVTATAMRERELDAANERLVGVVRASDAGGVRRSVGRLLIRAGHIVVGESAQSGSPALRPSRPIIA